MSYTDAKKVVYLQSIYKELESLVKEIGTVEGTSTTWNSIIGDQTSVNLSGFTNDAGFITAESDPTFATSPAASITQPDINSWNTSLQSGDNISELTNDAGYAKMDITNTGGFRATGDMAFNSNKITSSEISGRPTLYLQNYDDPSAGALIRISTADSEWRIANTYQAVTANNLIFRNQTNGITALELSASSGEALFGGDVIVGSTIADITAGPANMLTTKEWVQANSGGSGISSIVGGTGITVDNTDAANPVVNGIIPTGLEAIDEGNGVGWRLIGSNPDFYGDIGKGAIDLSTQYVANNERGATGNNSVSLGGSSNTSSGNNSISIGGGVNNASGADSIVVGGTNNTAERDRSIIIGGQGNTTTNTNEVIIGGTSTIPSVNYRDRIFNIGSGYYQLGVPYRSDAFSIVLTGRSGSRNESVVGIEIDNFAEVHTSEKLQVGGLIKSNATIAEIDAGLPETVPTKEWVQANSGGTVTTGFSGSFATATDTITVENGLITAVTPL